MRCVLRSCAVLVLCAPAVSLSALDVNAPMSITHELTVQPIVLSNDNGSDTAEYFGTASQQTAITDYIDDIWAQAGINVDWLAPTAWNNTDANQGNIGLSSVVSNGDAAGVDSDSPTVLNMYFVEDILAFSNPFSEYNAAGLAFIGGNGVTQYVGSNLLDFDGGRQTIASVVAHEIGHNLGLPHTGTALFQNLMNGSGTVQPNPPIDDDGERLTQEQINIALSSPLLVEVSTQMPDLNGDGFVGAADLDILLANWGSTTGTAATGDANGDGVTNQLDLDIVDAAWGTGTPSGGGVPEPGSLALLSLGGLVLLRRRQR